MPYRSKAQQRYFHARLPQYASEWDQATKKKKGGFGKLPERVHKIGRKEEVHLSQIRDNIPVTAGHPEGWSATHPAKEANRELSRRSLSRPAKLAGSYRAVKTNIYPGGPNLADRPIGHLTSSYRPVLSRKRTYAAAAGTAALAGGGALAYRHIAKASYETPTQRYQRHQHQVAAGLTAGAAIPALLALRSGRMASTAMAAGETAEHALAAGNQLKHAASATALGGIAGGVNAMPTPKRILTPNNTRNRNLKPARLGGAKHVYRTNTRPAKGFTRSTIGKAETMIDAFGVQRPDLAVVSKQLPPQPTTPKPSVGRVALGSTVPGVHSLVAGKKGSKLKAFGHEVGGGLAGSAVTTLATRGRAPGLSSLGALTGSALGTASAQRKGYLKPQS
jgi:hypothetical protein